MPFGVVNGVGREMGVLDGGGDRPREGAVLGVNLGRPIVTNGAFATCSSQITCCNIERVLQWTFLAVGCGVAILLRCRAEMWRLFIVALQNDGSGCMIV